LSAGKLIMSRKAPTRSGFTLLELLFVVAIAGVIAAIAIPLYRDYTIKAHAADLLVKYDGARSGAGANIAGDTVISECDEVLKRFKAPTIDDDYARIAYAFEAVNDGKDSGYRPVLTMCARAANQGEQAVKVTRAAHDELAKNTTIESGAVLTDTVVSFALPLTDPKRVVCRVPVGGPFTACGDPVAVPTLPPQNTPSLPPVVAPPQLPKSTPQVACTGGQQLDTDGKTCVCEPGKELVQLKTAAACAAICPPGTQRDVANNPLNCIPPPPTTTACQPGKELVRIGQMGQMNNVVLCADTCPPGTQRDLPANPFRCVNVSTPVTTTAPAITCNGGQQPSSDGKSCLCPSGQQFDGAQCFRPAVCTGGQVLSRDQKSCACPAGQTLQNGQCRTPAPAVHLPTAQQQLNTCLDDCAAKGLNHGQTIQCERGCRRRFHP
jgi:prepilin-type N-terminal cleavage/methylation domain-containing protein